MILAPGQFMAHTKRKTIEQGIRGLFIDFNYTTNWIGPTKIAIYGGATDIVESMVASEPFNGIISGFDDLAVGEYNTDSDYNNGVVWWNQVWPGTSGTPAWSDTGSSSLKAWFKFPTPLASLTKIQIRLRRTDLYGLPPNLQFFDMTGGLYVPISVPSGVNDYIEIIGSDRTYEWVFA